MEKLIEQLLEVPALEQKAGEEIQELAQALVGLGLRETWDDEGRVCLEYWLAHGSQPDSETFLRIGFVEIIFPERFGDLNTALVAVFKEILSEKSEKISLRNRQIRDLRRALRK